jgi:hypothetical protein
MPTLAQIATKIKNLAVLKAPKRTGKLKSALDTFNRPSGMIKESKTGDKRSFTFELDVSPPGAEYGKWWNDPTVSKTVRNGKTKNIDGVLEEGDKVYMPCLTVCKITYKQFDFPSAIMEYFIECA